MESDNAVMRRQNSRYIECGLREKEKERGGGATCVWHSVRECVKAGSWRSVSSVYVSLSQIASHRECASVVLLSSPYSRGKSEENARKGQWLAKGKERRN